MSYYTQMWKNGLDFSGRATRSEYWYAFLADILAAFILQILCACLIVLTNTPLFMYFYILYLLASFIPRLSLLVRRLHDSGKSGLWFLFCILLSFICGIGTLVLLVFLCLDSTPKNKWGPNPKFRVLFTEDDLNQQAFQYQPQPQYSSQQAFQYQPQPEYQPYQPFSSDPVIQNSDFPTDESK